jgi:hypothetical protein
MNTTGLTFIALITAIVLISGCDAPAPKSTPNPLAGWNFETRNPNQTIEKDFRDYIQTLPPEEKKYVGTIHFLSDGTGQHAINIEIGIDGTWWEHVLIYDKSDKQIKSMKYPNGHYSS